MDLTMNMVRLFFKDLSEVVGGNGFSVVRLVDANEQRAIGVIIDKLTSDQLTWRIRRVPDREKMLPEVLASLLMADSSANSLELRVYGVLNGQYQTILVHRNTLSLRSIRISDAVLLHYIAKVPLYMEADLLQRQSVPFVAQQKGISIPINTLDTERLTQELQRAIDDEDYRLASILHDELRRRNEH